MKVFRFFALCITALLIGVVANAQTIKVTGTVTETSGEPIIGAAVMVAGTTNGTATDIDGKFELNAPAGSNIEISCIGYNTVTLKAAATMNVTLEVDSRYLDEVVVTGYMTEKKADLTGSVAVVKMREVADIPTGNVMTALNGRVAGMNVTTDGTPGGQGTSSLIRGTTTINNSSPLYVIDGVMTRADIGRIVNSNDIESMHVLKDAASAAIYATMTLQVVRRGIPLLNAQEWGDVYWSAYKYDFGTTPKSTIYGDGEKAQLKLGQSYWEKDGVSMKISDTDWFAEAYKPALMQTYSLSLSKGSKDHVSSLSVNYMDQNGTMKNTDYKSIGTRYNSEYRFFNNKLKIGESLNVTYWTQHKQPRGYEAVERQLLAQHPAQAIYASDGTYAGADVDLLGSRQNPVRYLDNEANNIFKSWRIFGNAYIDITPVKNLVLRSSYGINYNPDYSNEFTPAWDEHTRSYSESALNITNRETLEWVWTNTANYSLNKGIHSAQFLLGTEAKKNRVDVLSAQATGFAMTSRDYVYVDVAEGTKTSSSNANIYAMTSVFAKANYTLADKYLFSATVRRDASSRFGKENNSGIFPSASFGWKINNEKFMASTKNWLSDLKLRASWGINGNDQINNTATYSIYGVDIWNGSYNLSGDNSTLSSGAVRTQSGNPFLRWEQTEQINLGLDAGFLNNRLTFSIDAYNKNTTDMLYKVPVAAIVGEGGESFQNCASMNNKGFEAIASWRNTHGDFSYEISANAAAYKNKITYLPEDLYYTYGCGNQAANVSNVGLPYGALVGYVVKDVFRTQAEVDAYNSKYTVEYGTPGIGRLKYEDVNNDGKINTSDQAYIGCNNPKLSFGLNFSASYKGWDLSMFFSGMFRDVYNTSKLYTDFFPLGEGLGNHSNRLLDAVKGYDDFLKTGTYTSKYAAVSTLDTNKEGVQNSFYIENGSFLKMKNLVIGYTLPSDLLSKAKIKSARVYLQGQNIFTLTKYTGPDPESLGYPYPNAFNLVAGLNIGF
ncbi:MAG: TonB-dependent receptor [Bacteroidales bacterium]|nr:TonB-dependent receptor [Bacteroidales bacterium]